MLMCVELKDYVGIFCVLNEVDDTAQIHCHVGGGSWMAFQDPALISDE